MATVVHPASLAALPEAANQTATRERAAAGVPWYIWTGVAAVTSSTIGAAWDVAWHRSVGRDTFWTPAHLMIQLCGVLAGVVGLWLVYQCTSGKNAALRASSVSIFGLRAPFGVFLAGWGGIAMLTSAPFDNWWHDAYGLDVKIVSPPHALLMLGVHAVAFGIFFLLVAAMNRAAEAGSSSYNSLRGLLLYMGGLVVMSHMFFLQEYSWDVMQHQALCYIALGIGVPVALATISQVSRFRWAATTVAAIYTAGLIAEILIFPLIHAEPKLGPVFYPVTHLVPAKFPVLILLPAIALDLLWQRTRQWKLWHVAALSGAVFVVVLFAVQWPFANFLMSPLSQNRFFGTIYFDYNSRPNGFDRLRQFYHPAYGLPLYFGLLQAAVYAGLSAWAGLLFGRWMRSVQR